METDVYETKDGVLVVFHDTSLKRMCGVDKNILDMIRFLSDIKKPVWIRHVLVPERSD